MMPPTPPIDTDRRAASSGESKLPRPSTDAERLAITAMAEAMPEGTARFRSVEPTGMGRNDYYTPTHLAILAFDALLALPIEARMQAMGDAPELILVRKDDWEAARRERDVYQGALFYLLAHPEDAAKVARGALFPVTSDRSTNAG